MSVVPEAPALARSDRTSAIAARELHLTSPPLGGEDVLALQRTLADAGYAPGRQDGVLGPATVGAVAAFQRDHDLTADGIVGPRTWVALANLLPAALPVALRRRRSRIGLLALEHALRHLGEHEDPPGSNRTHFGHWFGVNGVPWCNIFLSFCFHVGADYTLCAGFEGPGVYPRGCSYVPTTLAWLRATGSWDGCTAPLPGDIAVFDFDHRGEPEHIGLVERALGPDRFQTVEGNTAVGRDTDGGAVHRRLRYVTQVRGFGRIHHYHDH
jgi:hypothetical protein